jgi:hypothetical protein
MILILLILHPKRAQITLLGLWWNVWFPYVLTNCSNNYGPFHFPEKLIPLFINNIIQNKLYQSMETANTLVIGFCRRSWLRLIWFSGSKPRYVQYWWF